MRVIFALALFLMNHTVSSQAIQVTINGLKDKSAIDNSFLVLSVPDKTASELYQNTIKFINEKYKNPEEVVKGKTENEYLRLETYAPQFLKVKNSGAKLDVSGEYTIELRFKNGKVRYEIIELNMTADNGGRNVYFKGSKWKGYPIYDKNDKLRLPETKIDLENYFNTRIQELINYLMDKETNKDDW